MPRNFTNMIDYVQNELDTFGQRDVCRVDSLVFSWLAYFRLPEEVMREAGDEGLPLKDLFRADWFVPMCGPLFDTKSSIELLTSVAASPRFRDVRVSNYVAHTDEVAEEQFSAMTFHISPRETFVAFRGTDNTLVGWNEDFNISFRTAIPSQIEAVNYLGDIATRTEGRIWCGGHSKGGNLAVYAGVMCAPEVRERLVRCFSHDGPGFSDATMADPRWSDVASLVDKTIPQSSIVGMVFERQELDYTVVHSNASGFSQHDPFSWEVDWRDFVLEDKLALGANIFDSSINAWLASASYEDRARFVNAVFMVIEASGEETFAGIKSNWRTTVPRMAAAVTQLDAQDRDLVMRALADVLRTMPGVPSFPGMPRAQGQ